MLYCDNIKIYCFIPALPLYQLGISLTSQNIKKRMEVKMNSVSDILKLKGSRVWTITSSAPLRKALKLLAEKDIGALVVTKKGKPCGIFSERDLARKLAVENSLSLDTPVSKLMTSDLLTVSPSDSVEKCLQMMTESSYPPPACYSR